MPAKNYTRVTLYLTASEKEALQKLADEEGLKISSYVKLKLLGEKTETIIRKKQN